MVQSTIQSERNAAVLKSLLHEPENKRCADCKRSDYPRWASWSLGVFICIRCSGIHRSLGVHISKVKSVDLDTWTSDQVKNMQRWGNGRANLYWEATLSSGHIPLESKIENFIRTKYESKKWISKDIPFSGSDFLDEAKSESSINRPKQVISKIPQISDSVEGEILSKSLVTSSKAPGKAQESLYSINYKDGVRSIIDETCLLNFVSKDCGTKSQVATTSGQQKKADWKQSVLALYDNQSIASRSATLEDGIKNVKISNSKIDEFFTSSNKGKLATQNRSERGSNYSGSNLFDKDPDLIIDFNISEKLYHNRIHSDNHSAASAISNQSYTSANSELEKSFCEEVDFSNEIETGKENGSDSHVDLSTTSAALQDDLSSIWK